MDFPYALLTICKEFGLSPPQTDIKTKCTLILEDESEIHLESVNQDILYLYAYLFPTLEKEKTDQLCHKLMAHNTFGKVTRHATISLSEEKKSFLLSQEIDLRFVDEVELIKQIKKFISSFQHLRKEWLTWLPELGIEQTSQSRGPNNIKNLIKI
jgi:hypothetical protein